MNAPLRKPWTQDEFLAWAERQETRYEFDGLQPVAMTGGTGGHSMIGANVLFALRSRLNGGPCLPLGSDAGVETIDNAVRYPDALVTCTKFDPSVRKIPGVVVVFEVLSPSSGATDRVIKVREYAAVPSIRRYAILEANAIGLLVLERASPAQAWQTTALTNGDILRMPEIGIEIPVAEFYTGIDFTGRDNLEA
jgi:Uma2 family endonuclease